MFAKGLIVLLLFLHMRLSVCVNTVITRDGTSNENSLISILSKVASDQDRFNGIDSRITALDTNMNQRISALEEKVDELQSGSSETDKPSGSSSSSSNAGNNENVKSFYITDVTKNERDGYNHVRIGFKSPTPPTYVLYSYLAGRRQFPELVKDIDEDFVKIKVKVLDGPGSDDQYLNVMFVLDNTLRVSAHIKFDDNPNVIAEIPKMTLEVSPATFTNSSDAKFDVTMKVESKQEDIEYDSLSCELLIRNESESQRVDRIPNYSYNSRPVHLEIPEGDMMRDEGNRSYPYGNWVKTIKIRSSVADPRGIIELNAGVSFNCAPDCLLSKMEWTINVPFYNSRLHSSPFPEGFIGFIYNSYIPFPSRIVCDIRYASGCQVMCEAASNDPTTTDMTKVLANGDTELIENFALSSGAWSAAAISFHDDIFAAEGTYRCSARSEKNRVTMDIDVHLIKSAQIDDEESKIIPLEDDMILVVCKAEGTPAPNITFDTSYFPSDVQYDVSATVQEERHVSSASLVIQNPEGLSSVLCTATNVPENSTHLFLMMPEDRKTFYLDEDARVNETLYSYYSYY